MTAAPSPQRAAQVNRTLLSLRELIYKGEFGRGDRIAEIPLALRLGVSRTPLRLALEQLAHEGLVEASSGGGFFVRAFTVQDIHDSIELRGLLEGHAARLAAERLVHSDELALMKRCVAKMAEIVGSTVNSVESLVDYVDWNATFHAQLLHLAKSPMLERSFEHVVSLPFASPSAFMEVQARLPKSREVLVVAQEHHGAMMEAIANRNSGRAESLAREHSRLARRNLEFALEDRSLLQLVPGRSLIQLEPFARKQRKRTSEMLAHAI